jgi:hypothetical protein
MIRISFFVLCICAVSAVLPVSLQAQTALPGVRTFRLFTPVGHYTGLKYDLTTKQTIELIVNTAPGSLYTVPKSGVVTIYREIPVAPIPGTPSDAKPTFTKQIAATFSAPADISEVIVVLFPSANDTFMPKIVDDSLNDQSGETVKIFNFSTFPVAFTFHESPTQIPAGESLTVPFPKDLVLMQAAVLQGGQWQSFCRQERTYPAGFRVKLFIFNYAQDPDIPAAAGTAQVALMRQLYERMPVKTP